MGSDQEYKDRVRHDGKRSELIKRYGQVCSMCGKEEDSFGIVAHHLLDKNDHRFQVLLCRSCHAKLHGGKERIPIPREELEKAINSSKTLKEAQKKLGISKHGLRIKREKHGLLERTCPDCGSIYRPKPGFYQYCSRECADKAAQEKLIQRQLNYRDKKLEVNKRYYQKHRVEVLKKQKEYYEANREKILEYHKKLWNERRPG